MSHDPEAIAAIRASIAMLKTTKAIQEQNGNAAIVQGYNERIRLLEADLEKRCEKKP